MCARNNVNMPILPIGFFMPLPLPIMIPFMMWQSAAIAAGFGTYFQFAKRKVSAMSNEEFNKANPHDLVNQMYEDIVASIPSSFDKVNGLTPVILQSMNVMLDQAVKWFQGVLQGNLENIPNPFNQTPLPTENIVPDANLLSLTASEISASNDLVLASWIRVIQEYDITTQQLLLAEDARRKRTTTPSIEPPTVPQQTTTLSPDFVASLSKTDLEKGGQRTRNYKGKIQQWTGTHRIKWSKTATISARILVIHKWNGSRFAVSPPAFNYPTENEAVAKVNAIKRQTGSAYVLEFKDSVNFTWFLISQGHV